MKKLLAAFLTAGLFLSGCARVPFEPVRFSPLGVLDAETVRKNFESRLPAGFDIVESGNFQYRRHKFAFVGYTKANEKENTFASAGFTPVGLKVFELKAAEEKIQSSFSLPEKARKKLDLAKTARAAAEDIRRIYFGRVPQESAKAEKSKDRIVFEQVSGKGTLEFVFGGPDRALVEKSYRENGRKLWRVRYFSYTQKNGKIYPDKIYYENLKAKYRLTLRLKEITA